MLDNPDTSKPTQKSSHDLPDPGSHLIDLLMQRRSVSPLRLGEPGPNPDEVRKLLTIATRVPDHGMLEPWRVILVQGTSREKLAPRSSSLSQIDSSRRNV
jgi:nitroreductase